MGGRGNQALLNNDTQLSAPPTVCSPHPTLTLRQSAAATDCGFLNHDTAVFFGLGWEGKGELFQSFAKLLLKIYS